jgi:hypothetical protein
MKKGIEIIHDIITSKAKPKEKVLILASTLKDGNYLEDLLVYYQQAKDPAKGTCLSALTEIAKENPEFVKDCLSFIIDQIGYKAPRVKWEASETIAYVSKVFPEKVAKAIPDLMENSKEEGTVVRWSAAFALTEIAKNNPLTHKELIPYIEEMIETEKENGVRNVYVKALKILQKGKK